MRVLLISLFSVLVLSGCAGAKNSVSAKPTTLSQPTATPSQLVSPTPTLTPSSPTPTATPTTSPTPSVDFEFGVNTHGFSGDPLAKTRAMGAKWIRAGAPWSEIQPTRGQWNFSNLDIVVRSAHDLGLKIYGGFEGTPPWASSNGQVNGIPDVNAYREFVRTIVTRYKNDIRVWGVWNEPNLSRFWVGTAQQYVDVLLVPAHEVIKSIDSGILVAAPDLAFLGSSAAIDPLAFLMTIKNSNAIDRIDIVTHHAYDNNVDEFKKKILGTFVGGMLIKNGIKQNLEQSGLWGKTFWLTEFGWDELKVGRDQQASSLQNATQWIRSSQSWIKKLFVYELADGPTSLSLYRWGVLDENLNPKPSYYSLKGILNP